jgi:alkanesulfonate monooxygenase SsuD/methylene tetrahydromethanopterin reductase-like flavin-dependent oxidoreductase (luciferase family)
MTTLVTPEEFQDGWTRIREFSQKAGRRADAIESVLYYNVNLNPDREAAYQESKRFLDAYYMTDFSREVLEMWVAFGPPEECIEKIRRFVEAGARTITLRFCSWDQRGQMKACERELLPHFQ